MRALALLLMANVLSVEPVQRFVVEGDPSAPGAMHTCIRPGDVVIRADDNSAAFKCGDNGGISSGLIPTHYHNASATNAGVLDPARLGTGTPDGTKVLKGDGSWGTVDAGSVAWDSVTDKPSTFAPSAHVTSHESGGADALTLGSIAGAITAAQHGTPAGDLHPGYALDADLAAHEAAADPHSVYQKESEKGAASGYASLDAATKVPIAEIPTGTTATTVCIGNDARLSDARTPVAHQHNASDVNAGTVGTARLGSGTADSTTFLRGDQTWAAPPGGGFQFPVGWVLMSFVDVNPATFLGYGTWAKVLAGRVFVGQDAGQTEFDVLRETGGAKTHQLSITEMPAHTHVITSQTATTGSATSYEHGVLDTSSAEAEATEVTGSTGGGGAHNNLQPYGVGIFWERTA